MKKSLDILFSVVVPLYNESNGLEAFHVSLMDVLKPLDKTFEVIYIDDGSEDNTAQIIQNLHKTDMDIKLIKFSRNFGKENALSAGIAQACGQAIIMLDGDGQHPPDLIPKFIKAWQAGAQVVVGIRTDNVDEGWFKKLGSRFFYKLFNRFTGQKLVAGSTDFRLIDKSVQQAFLCLEETDRITRGLIDWLGFQREFINFKANPRLAGSPSYSPRKLMGLAANSFVSLSLTPLYLFGYLGVFITGLSLILGTSVLIEQIFLGDPWHWKFTGTAMLSILLLFLVGMVLMSQGILSLYISHIHNQSKRRPLYVIDHKGSAGLENDDE